MLTCFLILALCSMPTLWADSCDGLPGGPLQGDVSLESNEAHSYTLSVKPGGPAFRITVRPLWRLDSDRDIVIDSTRAGDIDVARCTNGERVQVLPIASDQPLSFASTFHAEDLNFDGYLDFSVVTDFAGTFGDARSYWVYDPASGIFVQNEFTHELRCGSAAITSKNGGQCMFAAFIDFDQAKHEIGRKYFGGAMGGCPNTGEGKGERYRVVNNRLILIHTQDFESIYQRGSFQYCAVTISDLVGGAMRVTEVRRYDAQGKRTK